MVDMASLIARVTRPNPGGTPAGDGGFRNDLDRIQNNDGVSVRENERVQVEAGPNGQGKFDAPLLSIFKNSTFTGIKDAPNFINVNGTGNTLTGGNIGSSDPDSPIHNTLLVSGSDNKLVAGDAGSLLQTRKFTAQDGNFTIMATGNELLGGKGDDVIVPSAGDKVVSGGAGDDKVELTGLQGFTGSPAEIAAKIGKFATFEGGEGDDTLVLPGNSASSPVTPAIKEQFVKELKANGVWDDFESIKWEGSHLDPEIKLK